MARQCLLYGDRGHDVCPAVRNLFLSAYTLDGLAPRAPAASLELWHSERGGLSPEHHSSMAGQEASSGA